MNFFGSAICSSACVLKICLINDVYELDCFPRYYNCRREEATKISILGGTEKAGCTIGLLAGDFLAPSLLSSIDKGVSMIDCMNRCNIDYVCIGNHESDVDLRQFHLRIKESRFTWLNSNIPYLPLPPDIPKLPEYKVIEFSNEDKTHTRRVALIGFATEDRSVMRPDAFSGCQIEAINEKARILYKKIMENEKVDAIIPMTHQLIHLDRDLARMNIGFPIILGGHDHEPYLETIGSSPACTIVKTGCDGKKFAICEICWPHTDATEPQISVVVRDADSYPADEGISSVINQHKTVLSELEKSVLFEIPSPSSSFSSVGIRRQPTSVGTYLCNIW